jgi:hypothetical protein
MSQAVTGAYVGKSVAGGVLGGILGGIGAGLATWFLMFVILMGISVRVDQIQGHPGGESDAGYIALFGVYGSIGFALVFAVVGAIVGAIAGASKPPATKWIGWGALASGVLMLLGLLLLLSGWFTGGVNVAATLGVIGAGAAIGAVAGAIAGGIGCIAGNLFSR